ncbi:MAG: LptA/OstA family protein [Myxococcota bacterium]
MKVRVGRWLWVALLCAWLAPASPAFAESAADARVGVALFETAGPPSIELPDVATLLADRIGTLGVARIVGPAKLAAAADASPSDTTVTELASRAGVDVIVVGRTTQIGGQLSIDVRLRSATTGKHVATYVGEVGRTHQLASVVETLAGQVIDGTVELWASAHPPAVSAQKPAPKPERQRRPFDNDKPISIKSNSLEATDVEGRRRLVFTGNVRVTQDDVKMTSDSLTATYPNGESQPSEMVARGGVRVMQNSQEVRCDTGTYKRREAKLMCCGHAELRDGADRVRGSCIEFDLNGETVRVEDAIINIYPDDNGSGDS